jgi:nucleotide-binding universal stress UspA family protein
LVIRRTSDGMGGGRCVQYKRRRGRANQEAQAVPKDRVLIAADLSKAAEAVLCAGLTLAERLGAETLVLHVLDEGEYQELRLAIPTIGIDEYAGNLSMRLRHLIASLEVPHEHARVEVLPSDGVAVGRPDSRGRAPGESGPHRLGTHGRTGLPRVLLGSVADAVSRRSDIPVLVVPTRAPASEGAPPFS